MPNFNEAIYVRFLMDEVALNSSAELQYFDHQEGPDVAVFQPMYNSSGPTKGQVREFIETLYQELEQAGLEKAVIITPFDTLGPDINFEGNDRSDNIVHKIRIKFK